MQRILPPDTPPICVRVLSTRDKAVEVREGIRHYYADDPIPDKLPYRAKALFVFQKNEDIDICFFGCVERVIFRFLFLFVILEFIIY